MFDKQSIRDKLKQLNLRIIGILTNKTKSDKATLLRNQAPLANIG